MPITITFSTAGSFTIEDDGIPGNNTSIVRRDSDGVILAVIPHPADSLIFRAIVPGVNLTVNVTDSLGSGSLLIGNLTDPNQSPDSIVVRSVRTTSGVTLVANGAIVEGGSDSAADIVANSIILSAQTGIGTGANAIETQTVQIEAETVTGGINIGNFGDVRIGGFSANVDGLDVITSGDILFTNLGTIRLSDETSFDSVHGGETAGNVTLIANGAESDIIADVDQSSIIANRGSVILTAGRDISFGLAGTEFGNDVRANNDIIVNAGRDFLLSGFADFFADGILGTTGGDIIVNAGRNVSLLDDTGNSASLATLGNGGGSVIITTGANGAFTIEAPSTNTISASGDVVVNADRMLIGTASGITTAGTVTLRPVTAGREIVLGSLSDGGVAVELSDGELDRIFADNLVLGSASTGLINVGAPIAPGGIDNWTLQSGTTILIQSTLAAPGTLTLLAGDDILQTTGALTAAAVIASVDQVQDDGSFGGFTSFLGTVTAATRTVNGSVDADTLNAPGTGSNLFGNGGNDILRGSAVGETLSGGTGDDSMTGLGGDDTYSVDSAGDVVVEAAGEGTNDRVLTAVTYTLPSAAEIELLATSNAAATTALDLTGNGFNQIIIGNAGINILSGGDGNDTMFGNAGNDTLVGGIGNDVAVGGPGDDVYNVDSFDAVIEAAAEGNDRVLVTASYNLTSNSEVELLTTINQSATTAIDIVGNNLSQTIFGNEGINRLAGAGASDSLFGLGGNDVLDGGAGLDQLNGGAGDDVYAVDNAGDLVVETAGNGADRVLASVSYALGAGVEVELMATPNQSSVAPLDLTGNELANNIQANNGANLLRGLGGNDVLFGLDGADTLNGGAGVDQLTGGAGADNLVFADALGATNIDLVFGFVTGSDKIQLDDAVFTAFAPGTLPAGALRLGTSAADANDRILYDQATGRLFYDPDATGAAAPVHFATLSGNPIIAESDFAVI